MKTLHLVLKHKWYDLIDCGAKTSEYRACTPYWNQRMLGKWYNARRDYAGDNNLYVGNPDLFDVVVFHRGYTAQTMQFHIISIHTTTEPNDLHENKCWEIQLGERLA